MPIKAVDGCSIFYEVNGKGIPVMFVHPPVLTSVTFTHQVDELSKTMQTIIFDIRGHGKSGSSWKTLTYPLIVEDMIQLLNELQIDKVFLCGYSTGASIVLEFLLTHPERAFGSVLVGALSEVRDSSLKRKISLAAMCAKISAVKPLAFYVTWSNSDNPKLFWKAFKEAGKGKAKNIEEYYRSSLKYNCTARLPEIKNPVLLVYGAKDHGFHPYARLALKNLPHSQLVFVPDVKHQIPTKAANELNLLIKNFVVQTMERSPGIQLG